MNEYISEEKRGDKYDIKKNEVKHKRKLKLCIWSVGGI